MRFGDRHRPLVVPVFGTPVARLRRRQRVGLFDGLRTVHVDGIVPRVLELEVRSLLRMRDALRQALLRGAAQKENKIEGSGVGGG